MPVCPVCGSGRGVHEPEVCLFHAHQEGRDQEGWAVINRIWCDFFHRGKEIVRVPDEELVVLPGYYEC